MDILLTLGIICTIVSLGCFTLGFLTSRKQKKTKKRRILNLYIGNNTPDLSEIYIEDEVSYVDESGSTVSIESNRFIPFRVVGYNKRVCYNDIVLVEVFNHKDYKLKRSYLQQGDYMVIEEYPGKRYELLECNEPNILPSKIVGIVRWKYKK